MNIWVILWWILLIAYIPCCIGLIAVVLLQKGKGVGFAGAFGFGGGSDTVFGPRAGKSLPVRLTHFMAGGFMVLALLASLVQPRAYRGTAPELAEESATPGAYESLVEKGLTVEPEPTAGAVAPAGGIEDAEPAEKQSDTAAGGEATDAEAGTDAN